MERTQTTLTSALALLADVYLYGSSTLLSNLGKSANNARPTLLSDSSQHPLGINV